LTPGGDWEINRLGDRCKAQLAEKKHSWLNPPKNVYEATAIWETNVKNRVGNTPKNLQRTIESRKAKTLPETLTMAKDSKAIAVGKSGLTRFKAPRLSKTWEYT